MLLLLPLLFLVADLGQLLRLERLVAFLFLWKPLAKPFQIFERGCIGCYTAHLPLLVDAGPAGGERRCGCKMVSAAVIEARLNLIHGLLRLRHLLAIPRRRAAVAPLGIFLKTYRAA